MIRIFLFSILLLKHWNFKEIVIKNFKEIVINYFKEIVILERFRFCTPLAGKGCVIPIMTAALKLRYIPMLD